MFVTGNVKLEFKDDTEILPYCCWNNANATQNAFKYSNIN